MKGSQNPYEMLGIVEPGDPLPPPQPQGWCRSFAKRCRSCGMCCRNVCFSRTTKTLAVVAGIAFIFTLIVLANNNADGAFRYAFQLDVRLSHDERDIKGLQQQIDTLEKSIANLEVCLKSPDGECDEAVK